MNQLNRETQTMVKRFVNELEGAEKMLHDQIRKMDFPWRVGAVFLWMFFLVLPLVYFTITH